MKNLFAGWRRGLLALGATSVAATSSAQTAPVSFSAGNLVVLRVGDGTAVANGVAASVYLLEYTPAGALVQTVAVPATDNGPNLALTLSSSATSEGLLTRSGDGRYLVLAGYGAAPGTAGVASTAAATTNRVIARIAYDGTINTTTRISDAFDANNVRSATSADGSAFYAVGANGGVRYVPLGGTGATTALTPTTASTGSPVNLRVAGLFGGNLYVSTSSSGVYGLAQVGTGRPTTAGQALAALPGFPAASGPSPYGFFFADLSAAVPGPDVVYVADDGSTGGIQKWSLVGGTWTLNGTIGGNTSAAVRGLAGSVNLLMNPTSPPVTLAASGGGGLFVVTDNAGYNAAPSTTTLPAAVATPAANTAFRGVALAPLATALPTRPAASAQELALYPNPAQDVLLLALPTGSATGHQAEVRDLLGRVVRSVTVGTPSQLSVAGLAAGTYLLTLDGTLTRRFTKAE